MTMTRREFIATLGGTGLLYAFRLVPGAAGQESRIEPIPSFEGDPECAATFPGIDYSEWIAFGPGGTVTVFTGRTEIGQGLKTVLVALVTQGLDIPAGKLTVVLGDTDCCPDDGSTAGSSSTRLVGWAFWLVCETIRQDLLNRAARMLAVPIERLLFKGGGIRLKNDAGRRIDAADLSSGEAVLMDVDPTAATTSKEYVDLGIPNVNAGKIVTGTLQYVGDLKKPGMLYAGLSCPPYHPTLTKLQSARTEGAQKVPGIKLVDTVFGRVAAVGERYSDVLNALPLVEQTWSRPKRPKAFPIDEVRIRTKLLEIKENEGDIAAGLAQSDLVLSETYTTQYVTNAQIETDTALAQVEDDRVTVWASSQYPHGVRELTARHLDRPLSSVRVIGMPVGGGFGSKQTNPVNWEAAKLARQVGSPVKLVYSRKDQFQMRGSYKAACIIDLTSGVSSDGRMIARKADIYQDLGFGTTFTYDIPNVLTKTYRRPDWPLQRGIVRGTSFVQTCFAIESHVDVLANRLGIDPVDFRRKNIQVPVFRNLIDVCAERIGYDRDDRDIDEGIGMALIKHGGAQYGAAAARVAVDRQSGTVKVKKVCAAFDIGTIINRRTTTVGIRGAIMWGIGYALFEEIKLDGHSAETEYLSQYRVPRFSDVPEIDIVYLNNHNPNSGPRGCGEIPVIPTIGAIANAIFNATGVRLYSTPFTPEKIKQALAA